MAGELKKIIKSSIVSKSTKYNNDQEKNNQLPHVNVLLNLKEYIKSNPNPDYNEQLPHNINEFDAGEYIDEFWRIYRYKLSFESTYKEDTSTIIDKLKSEIINILFNN